MSDYLPPNCSDRDLDEHYGNGMFRCWCCGAVYEPGEQSEYVCRCGADICDKCWSDGDLCVECGRILGKEQMIIEDDIKEVESERKGKAGL